MGIMLRISELDILLETKSEYVKKMCEGYLSDAVSADISASVTREEIERERSICPGYADDYYEFICLYRNICLQLPLYDRMLVHSAVIESSGRGYAFSAKSGVGKTTHIKLWKRVFKDDVTIINGDKPIYRFDNGRIFACGTPWCGKERYATPRETELCAIGFITRAEQNSVTRISSSKALKPLMDQVLLPKERESAVKTLELCSKLLESLPCYRLGVNMEDAAATVARETLDRA